jgi:HupE / UreJ protein
MKRAVALFAICLLFGKTAWAHRIDEYLQATIISLEVNRAYASMRLIPGVMVAHSVIDAIDSNHDGVVSKNEERAYADRVLCDLSISLDGQPLKAQLDSWTFPEPSQLRDGLGQISIQYHIDLPSSRGANRSLILENHHKNANSVYLMNAEVPRDHDLRIVDQRRNERQSIYELDYQQLRSVDMPSGSWKSLWGWLKGLQFSSLFRLGMRHIAEGTDHLLFLLMLMLPAPLLVVASRWKGPRAVRGSLLHIVSIVTAFTVGHSLTLSLAAMNFVHVPSRPVEVLIAVSILVSAIHALRPIFPGKEAWIAAFFGLIHGLAFATTLDQLGLSRWNRLAGILAFNLGIETMQLFVVAAVLPSLLLMSRTKLYPFLRIGGAVIAGLASTAWIAERIFDMPTPVNAVVNIVARHGALCAVALFVASFFCKFFGKEFESN